MTSIVAASGFVECGREKGLGLLGMVTEVKNGNMDFSG
jgi:hypothetical protein